MCLGHPWKVVGGRGAGGRGGRGGGEGTTRTRAGGEGGGGGGEGGGGGGGAEPGRRSGFKPMRCSSVAHRSTCACGKAVATALTRGRIFFEGSLPRGSGARMPWTWDLQTVLGAHDVAPAQMVGDRVAQAGAAPAQRRPRGPADQR